MNRLVAAALASLAVLLVLPALSGYVGARAEAPAAVGPYYKMYTGLDFDSLDSDDVVLFASGTGGGVYLRARTRAGDAYLETALDLPTGAEVTAITFYVRNCENLVFNRPQLYFGAYSPASGNFAYYIPEDFAGPDACDTTQAINLPVNPVVTVENSQFRYVIGFRQLQPYATNTYDSSLVKALLVGARVTYQLPGALLPIVQR